MKNCLMKRLMSNYITISDRRVGKGYPVLIVAEMSANHHHDFTKAVDLIKAAKGAGADAIKLQTYTPDTITINSNKTYFQIKEGTLWDGRTLYDLYGEAYTPWEWQPQLKKVAEDLGLIFFSTPFDFSGVEFLENIGVPCWKVASFEIVDLLLIQKMAQTGKPILISTGMATFGEIEEAVTAANEGGATELALLKCTSAYPAPMEEMNLKTIPHMSEAFNVPVGLSDHTLGISVPIAAVALGACIVEKHLTLSRKVAGPDSAFSLEPNEFKNMVHSIRNVEKSLGNIHYGLSEGEIGSRFFRRSLFVVKDMKARDKFTEDNVRSIRPGHGLHTRHFREILGRRASIDIARGTPLNWKMISD